LQTLAGSSTILQFIGQAAFFLITARAISTPFGLKRSFSATVSISMENAWFCPASAQSWDYFFMG
jgi:hypothetical protein